jgi:hypothetical protein
MKITNKFKLASILCFFAFFSCETTELDLTVDPNNFSLEQTEIRFLYNGVQVSHGSFIQSMGANTSDVMRQTNMSGNQYENAFGPTSFSGSWNNAYRGVLKNVNVILQKAEGNPLFDKYVAASKIISANVLITLVDVYGDVPWSEAFNEVITSPKLDSGSSVYSVAEGLLNEAIVLIDGGQGVAIENEKHYNSNMASWKKLANTLKMKIYYQSRLVDASAVSKFEAIVSSGNYISTNADNFVFSWGDNLLNPNSRHPWYNAGYGPGGVPSIGFYMSNHLMNLMRNSYPKQITPAGSISFTASASSNVVVVNHPSHNLQAGFLIAYSGVSALGTGGNSTVTAAKLNQTFEVFQVIDANSYTIRLDVDAGTADTNTGGANIVGSASVSDPRMAYYFYRQVGNYNVTNATITSALPCLNQTVPAHYPSNMVFCRLPNGNTEGWWGRDHGNQDGIPPDGTRRTLCGLYPAGGRIDDKSFKHINDQVSGAKGNGVTPIVLSSTVDFWRAELTNFGGSGSLDNLILSGVSKSIDYVSSFLSRDTGPVITQNVPTAAQKTVYINELTASLAAASTSEKLEIWANQFLISTYGNGLDSYAAYRRTGFPKNIQMNIEPNPGPFMRTFWYPDSEVSANANVSQKPNLSIQTFWDNNPITGFLQNN